MAFSPGITEKDQLIGGKEVVQAVDSGQGRVRLKERGKAPRIGLLENVATDETVQISERRIVSLDALLYEYYIL